MALNFHFEKWGHLIQNGNSQTLTVYHCVSLFTWLRHFNQRKNGMLIAHLSPNPTDEELEHERKANPSAVFLHP